MAIKIEIEKRTQAPAYRQIIQQVTSLIKDGVLKPGDKLKVEDAMTRHGITISPEATMAEFREAIADKSLAYNHIPANPETDITVTCGVSEAMMSTVLALTDPGAYAGAYPGCGRLTADANVDGAVNAFDIDPFIALLTGP